ncbi:MAG: glutathione S-transferase C-terminal domain-containing protein [Pseudomonadota bacterium]
MGLMIDGVYRSDDPEPGTTADGSFQRQSATIRNQLPRAADIRRYHLFAAWNCPWAHRVLLVRALIGLELSVSYALPRRTDEGWVFEEEGPYSDQLFGASALHEVYARHRPAYTGRITVPLLWDRETDTAISNESADLVRMLGKAKPNGLDLCPQALEEQIDSWNALVYPALNNGVYRAGFARTQAAYDIAVTEVFAALDEIEAHLAGNTWLCGEELTEADVRLFPTLARFDVAYHYAFKCNIRRLSDYPRLWTYARRFYALPGVARTVRFDIYKQGYFSPSELRNPLGIVPRGPDIDWTLSEDQ